MTDAQDALRTAPPALEQTAVQALLTVSSQCVAPRQVECLKYRDSRVYVGRLVGADAGGGSVIAKWCPLTTGAVERCIYEEALPALGLTRLHYYGSCADGDDFIWLFLEDGGNDAVSFRDPRHRPVALRWLAALLDDFHTRPEWNDLPERGPGHYFACLSAGRNKIMEGTNNPALSEKDSDVLHSLVALLDRLASDWVSLEREYADLPKGLVHGDFKEKNVRLRRAGNTTTIVAYDWENAGWGIPGIDWWHFDDASCLRYMSESWPNLTEAQTSRLKVLGGIFWCIDAINWGSRSLPKPWAAHMIQNMVYYHRRMSELYCAFRPDSGARIP